MSITYCVLCLAATLVLLSLTYYTNYHMKNNHNNTQIQQARPPSTTSMAAAQQQRQQAAQVKWSGKARAELRGCKAEQVWPLWADFGGLHKWFPNLCTSRLLAEGEAGKLESIRFCVGKVLEDEGHEEAKWAKERLVEIDDEKRLMRYELMENNVGLKGYAAEIRVADTDGGCAVEWSFEAEAVVGWCEEGLQSYVQSSLEAIVNKMGEELCICCVE